MTTFTEVDFYKSMLKLQVMATEIAKNKRPVEQNGKISYPVDDGKMDETIAKKHCLEVALAILKQDNS